MVFAPSSKSRVAHKLSGRLECFNHNGFKDYLNYLSSERSEERDNEIKVLLDVLTVNETFFFRNKTHFDTLKRYIVPQLMENKLIKMDNTIRVWSAGCSTGQEPYSIAMVLDDALGFRRNEFEIVIYGTDISETALKIAREGVYENRRVGNVPPEYFRRYFRDRDGKLEVVDSIKKIVEFQYGNLKEPSMFSSIDIIFCRNVMIYFDMDMNRMIAEKFYNTLVDDGYLIKGHSETFQGITNRFNFTMIGDGIVYRKNLLL
jgi:chemotaxis protein methyltransferase CheR